jgi:hypothetical protein
MSVVTELGDSRWGRSLDLFTIPNIGNKEGLAGDAPQRLDPNIAHDWTVYVHRPDLGQQGAVDLKVEWGSGGSFQEETYPGLFAIRSVFHFVSAYPPRVSVRRASLSVNLPKGQDIIRCSVAPGRPVEQVVSGCVGTPITAGTVVADWRVTWELPFGTQSIALLGTYIGIPLVRVPIAITHGPIVTTTGSPMLTVAQGVENGTVEYAVMQGAGVSVGSGSYLSWAAQPFVVPASVGGLLVYWRARVLR